MSRCHDPEISLSTYAPTSGADYIVLQTASTAGLVKLGRGKIIVLDPDALARRAE